MDYMNDINIPVNTDVNIDLDDITDVNINTLDTENNTYYFRNNRLNTLIIKKPEKSEKVMFYIKKTPKASKSTKYQKIHKYS